MLKIWLVFIRTTMINNIPYATIIMVSRTGQSIAGKAGALNVTA